ncbi:MAG: hypothetical protein ACK5WB_00290 [Phycisphaerales bacterium]|jgi:hypothetical protein|nr:hypothetical protein [Phycisphaeraceae bacterium]MTA11654.1 hypothetical protein [Actinomycetota bacterium]
MPFLLDSQGPLPAPGTRAELLWIKAGAQLLLSLCPIQRQNSIYIEFNANGSATGAVTGANPARNGTTPALAFGARHTADLAAIIAANAQANTTIYLRRGDVFRCDPANLAGSQTNINLNNITITGYRGTATAGADDVGSLQRAPQILGFLAPFAGGWTLASTLGGGYAGLPGNVWFRSVTQTVYHTRFAEDDPRDGAAGGMGRQTIAWGGRLTAATSPTITAQLATLAALDQDSAVYDPTNQRLFHVSRSARNAIQNTTGRIEAQIATTRGISVGDVTGFRSSGLVVAGWGMNSDVGVSQAYCIHLTHEGNKYAVIDNCVVGYSGHHAYGHLVTALNATGGTTLYWRNSAGFTQGDNLGNSTVHVDYAQGGGNEFLVIGDRLIGGNLRSLNLGTNGTGTTITSTPRGVCQGWYGHAGANQPPPALAIIMDCEIDEDAVADGGSVVFIGGADGRGDGQSQPNAELATSWGRSRVILCRQPLGRLGALSLSMDTSYLGCDVQIPWTSGSGAVVALNASNNNLLFMGSRFEIDARSLAGNSTTYWTIFATNTGSTPVIAMANSQFTIKSAPNQMAEFLARFRSTEFSKSFGVNSRLTFLGGAPVSGTDKNVVGFRNGAPAAGGTGGMAGCEFFGVREVPRDFGGGNVVPGVNLTDSPTFLDSPFALASATPRVQPHLDWLRPEYDLNGRELALAVLGPLDALAPPIGGPRRLN